MTTVQEYIRQAKRYVSQMLLFLVKKIVNLHGDPRHIASGFALGVFVGMTPTMGAQMAIAAPLAALFKWNVCAAMMGVWITTPATAPFIYGTTYLVGRKIVMWWTGKPLPLRFRLREIPAILSKTPRIFSALTVGGILIGLPAAVVSYYLAYFLIQEYRKDKEKVITYIKNTWLMRWLHITHEHLTHPEHKTEEDSPHDHDTPSSNDLRNTRE